MEQLKHIEDTSLPLEINFEELKERGLAFIQRNNDSTWTNLNPSDPGVTILDQLCFAFTELGYCTNFPIKDILTNKEGKLQIKNQFYEPEDILTTSPITINDFRKYVVDQVKEVINLQIIPYQSSFYTTNNTYKVQVLINPNVEKNKQVKIIQYKNGLETVSKKSLESIILEQTFFALNSSRNLGELFLYPTSLIPKKYAVYGKLELETGYDINSVLTAINFAINNYVFPKIIQSGYGKLKKDGETSDTIFNGPKLKNGWIANSEMQPKRNKIQTYQLTEIIQSVHGVASISEVEFNNPKNSLEVNSLEGEILVFDFIQSLGLLKKLNIYNSEGKNLNKGINSLFINKLSELNQPIDQISKVSSIKMAPKLPQGNYRDIENYFSIQTTFPDAYTVGSEGVSANATAFQIAQSRQLKGYLTLFDQVLTNQFMQLASLDKLFSFENSVTGTPSDKKLFFDLQTAYEKTHSKYPSPFVCFSPTYYYQSLYKQVPHIRPLLRNFKKHQFSYNTQSVQQKTNNSWTEYKQDPYSSYMWGLMSFMENEDVNLDRRNDILDHLLARHGESPILINTIIEGTVYSGNSKKDKVIIKSLYLQNLGLLSYYKTKGYDFIGATKLTTNYIAKSDKLPNKLYHELKETLVQGNQKNFIFDTLKVNKELKIEVADFTDFSALELKLNLLFALNVYYQDYLIQTNNSYAFWLITQRKGFLCIETSLLKESADYEIIITEDSKEKTFWRFNNKLSYKELLELEILLKEKINFVELQERYSITEILLEKDKKNNFEVIENSTYSWAINISWNKGISLPISNSILENSLILVFPKFFDNHKDFKISDFKKRLHYFLNSELPVQTTTKSLFVKDEQLKEIILAYSQWYNNLRYDQENGTLHGSNLINSAQELIVKLNYLTHD